MDDLNDLKIDRSMKTSTEPSRWATRWIVSGVLLFVLLGAARFVYGRFNQRVDVQITRVVSTPSGSSADRGQVILNATGYIVAAHKIQLASKVMGKVSCIGVEKGDKVQQGQIIVRLEDDEYRAQLEQARGQLASLQAWLKELRNGSRPEEVSVAKSNVDEARADLENAKVNLNRVRQLMEDKVLSRQAHDDAKAKFDAQSAKVASLEKSYELVRIGPRQELIEQVQGQIQQARGSVAFYETQLANTVIRAPVTGTILERVVEKGEFVTTSFVGERGAKGYVVSMQTSVTFKWNWTSTRTTLRSSAPSRRASSPPTRMVPIASMRV